ncbi:phage tail domain-containing protein [Schinkia azotoformans]|uniref:phage tail domain-containing protein n=1 Tax=Schinkia azotoformans TaxID=1454 RepID=UPI002DBB9449|nr:phage tail domain-containing protein [Schinkia azotoformans]MEC1786091.1 phage tail family protein [Schinkia azotoformans]MED4420127.1 phage tail family protein [Schinkia azotoformans]
MNSVFFSYDGLKSSDLGVYLVKLDKGLVRDPFLGEREIISETIAGNETPYIYDVRTSSLRISLTLSCLDGAWTLDKRREVARWLDKRRFCEFYSTDNIEKLYYLQYVGGIDLYSNSANQGYITVEFLNISPYTYSPFYVQIFDYSTITTPTTFEFTNSGDNNLYPEIWVEKVGTGEISIVNLSNGGKDFKFTGLLDQEVIYVDNRPAFHHIESSLPNTYRHDNFSGEFLELTRGVNRLQLTGKCILKFMHQFELKG